MTLPLTRNSMKHLILLNKFASQSRDNQWQACRGIHTTLIMTSSKMGKPDPK